MAIANISIADATTPTPVTHVFVPVQDGNEARYVNEAGAQTLKGQETLAFDVKRQQSGGNPNTVRVSMWDPTEVAAPDGTYSVKHGSSFDLRFNFAQAEVSQSRKNLVRMAINVLTALEADIAALKVQL